MARRGHSLRRGVISVSGPPFTSAPPPLRCFPPKGVFPQRGLEERTRWGARGRCVHWGEDKYRGEGAVPLPPGRTRTPGSSGMAGFRD